MTESPPPARILLVDDEKNICLAFKDSLELQGYQVEFELKLQDARRTLAEFDPHLLILDISFPGSPEGGVEWLRDLRQERPELCVIMSSDTQHVSLALEVMRLGIFDFLEKPVDPTRLVLSTRNALAQLDLKQRNQALEALKQESWKLIGDSQAMSSLKAMIQRIADKDVTTLILGETGTGKELVARALHEASRRHDQVFMPINCGSIPETLIESYLFGHVRGAFTGADAESRGLIRAAQGGTLFLDEIGELSIQAQARLLRFLEDHQVRPIGGAQSHLVDVRVVAATNRDLGQMIKDGDFKEDLWYRLNSVVVDIPPLRERSGDLVELAAHFLKLAAGKHQLPCRSLSTQALEVLQRQHLPGNVRELRSLMERLTLLGDHQKIEAWELLTHLDSARRPAGDRPQLRHDVLPLRLARQAFEREVARRAVDSFMGNQSEAAAALEVDRSTLYRIMKRE